MAIRKDGIRMVPEEGVYRFNQDTMAAFVCRKSFGFTQMYVCGPILR